MKTNILLESVFLIVIISCASPKLLPSYLPQPSEIDINYYGSYISLYEMNKTQIEGELISIDSSQVVVLVKDNHVSKVVLISLNEINGFELRYAVFKDYRWAIPVFTLSTLIPFPDPAGEGIIPFHGFFAVFTTPINLITTITVANSSAKAFLYNNMEISLEELKPFARFPQGIPKTINPNDIK